MTAALVAGALLCGSAPPALASPSVTVVLLPPATTVDELSRVPTISPGVISAGIGEVPPLQTYLDISQGNRVDEALYETDLPAHRWHGESPPDWPGIVRRGLEVPAEIEPGLLASTLEEAGLTVRGDLSGGEGNAIATNRLGRVRVTRELNGCLRRPCAGLAVAHSDLAGLSRLAGLLRGEDLVIAVASPAAEMSRVLPIGLIGRGFGGNLTSDSTRTDGYVLSIDIGPTILRRFGLSIPGDMDGEPIRSAGAIDPGAAEELADRMSAIPDRRAPLLIACLGFWIALAVSLALISPSARRGAAEWLALAFAYLPLTLLAGAALEPGGLAEGLLVGLGAATLAAATFRVIRGWAALAFACAITVLAFAIDVVAGSELTRLSLLGPNPIYGVRFYGIGNELEALFAVMVPVAVGAGLTAAGEGRPIKRSVAVAAFLVAGGLAAAVFAAGRFGADVGAAIVLPLGAAVAAVICLRDRERFSGLGPGNRSNLFWGAVVIAAPIAGLVLLAFIDLVSGGDAHLTRSVIDAGGAGDLADLTERRLRLSAHDFAQAAGNPLFWLVVAALALAIARRRQIDAWLTPAPMARAGVLGACAAVAVGVLANDSGASFLVLGALALGACLAFAWAERPSGG